MPLDQQTAPKESRAMIQKVGIIGAGQMGNGIAQACAVSGLDVTMVDINDAAVQRGITTISGSLDRLVKKEKLSAADKDAAVARVKGSTDYAALKDADLVVEAATENLELLAAHQFLVGERVVALLPYQLTDFRIFLQKLLFKPRQL